ncbi:MAG: rod shape-determining protein RodA [Thermodesulfobacteriota bacterium]
MQDARCRIKAKEHHVSCIMNHSFFITMFDKRLVFNFDWIFLLLVLSLAGLGVIGLYGTTSGVTNLHAKQINWLVLGVLVMVFMVLFNYQYLEKYTYSIYAVTIVVLILVLFVGRETFGARRWMDLGFISFQPSEFTKLVVVLTLSRYFSQKNVPSEGMSLKDMLFAFALIAPLVILVLIEPDLGTASIILLIYGSITLFAKVRFRVLILAFLSVAALIPVFWHFLKDYQKSRVLAFLNPGLDPLGAGYQIIQSKIAIGSGGWGGKGYMLGTQSKLKFLPAQSTDFVFSVIAEEWGFIGAIFFLSLFLLLMLWTLTITLRAKDRFGAFLSFGIGSLLFWHVFINLGMVTGILPVVGVPLPFLSYGGSFFVTLMVAIGLLLNISMRRFMF